MAPYFNNNSLRDIHNHSKATVGYPVELGQPDLTDLMGQDRVDFETFTRRYLERLAQWVRPDIAFQNHLFKSIETPYIEQYEKIFPDMRFIHIIRNPIAVCSSQKRSLLENKKRYASYLGYDWLSCMLDSRWVPHARLISERLDDPRHIVLRYEDLVKDPEGEINRIATHLGLVPPPRPKVQTIFHDLDKSTWGGNPSKKGVDTPNEVVPNLQQKNQYKEVLTQREIALISVKTRLYLGLLGYESSTDVTKLQVILSYFLLDRWEWVNCSNLREVLRALYGVIYRRLKLF